jgi:formate dehydrogenase iron-sulfur subunit
MSRGDHGPAESFYHLRDVAISRQACQGTACFAARHLDARRWADAISGSDRIYCLGRCYLAPAAADEDRRPHMGADARQPIVMERLAGGPVRSLAAYTARGGYTALERVLGGPPAETLRAVEISGLRGRGGAGFPTGRKWRAVADQPGDEKYVVANADEGDPGAYIDRYIVEDDPHCLIEALAIAGYAVGAHRGYVYLRKEYPEARGILEAALREARGARMLGDRVLGRAFSFDVQLVIGQGSYVCGEETALLNSIEGRRPEVRVRPPYPAQAGLFGRPTLVNNVETLASVTWIVRHGGAAYAALGFSRSRGTKVVSLNSLFQRPGLYEIEFGVPVRHIVETLGGGLRTGPLTALMIGGPLTGLLPPVLLDVSFGFEELRAVGASVGHGGIIGFDQHTSIPQLVHHVFRFAAFESCGKCTPCRVGSGEIERVFERIVAGGGAARAAGGDWAETLAALRATSLCGHGTGLAEFAESVARHYPEELAACFA